MSIGARRYSAGAGQPIEGRGGVESVLDMTVTDQGGTFVIELAGELDAETAPLAAPSFDAAIAAADTVIVDLSALAFIDEAGALSLRSAEQRAAARACRLVWTRPLAHVALWLQFVGIEISAS